jgi:hypothetical protein
MKNSLLKVTRSLLNAMQPAGSGLPERRLMLMREVDGAYAPSFACVDTG